MTQTVKIKQPESWLWHLCGFIIPGLTLWGNLYGSIWVAAMYLQP